MLKIHNSLARAKQTFIPIVPGKVSLYVCGMTVYDYCHLGHARVLVAFDMVRRWFQTAGFNVTYVRNITDIDDKIIGRAAKNHEPVEMLTQRFIQAMHQDAALLGVESPEFEPRATQYVPKMIAMIDVLIAKGLAYVARSGDVCYSVHKFPGYGRLSGKSLADLRAGERVGIAEGKNDPLDFVLWKSAKPGEPTWDSPWGSGRPGWHIECSAMGDDLLGAHFDIHGGGQDLQFPHHENEIAQSEGVHGHPHVNYWMHNGFVRVDNEKMSKSLGNFFTIREVLQRYDPEIVRFFILRAHYRSPLNYSDRHLDDAKQALTRLYTALKNVPPALVTIDWDDPSAVAFKVAMDNDFGTPEAVAVLFDLASEINRCGGHDRAGLLKALGGILGLLQRDPSTFLHGKTTSTGLSAEQIEQLIGDRSAAKIAKNYVEADRIRQELASGGILLEDTPQGTCWRRG